VSEGVRESFWRQGMMAGFPAATSASRRSPRRTIEDLKNNVPTLIMQGDDDQIVPFADSGLLQSKLVKGATLKVYKGAPHGLCTTNKDRSARFCSRLQSLNIEHPCSRPITGVPTCKRPVSIQHVPLFEARHPLLSTAEINSYPFSPARALMRRVRI